MMAMEELEDLVDQEATNKGIEHIQAGKDLIADTYKKIWRRKNKNGRRKKN